MAFRNPSGSWDYAGPFSVILTAETPTHLVPPEASVVNEVVRVSKGRVYQVMGGIQFNAFGKDFSWGYSRIIGIFDGDWNPIWINDSYNK